MGRATGEQWFELFEEPKELSIFAPSDLAELGKDQLHIVSGDPDSNRLLGQLWGEAKVAGGVQDLAERPCPSPYVQQRWDAYVLAYAISADSAKNCEPGRAFPSHASDLGPSAGECDATGPREKIRRVAEGATSAEQISQFPQAGAQLGQPAIGHRGHQVLRLSLRCGRDAPLSPYGRGSVCAVELLRSW